jgi:hypothetical protein
MRLTEQLIFTDSQPIEVLQQIVEKKMPPEFSKLIFDNQALRLWSFRVATSNLKKKMICVNQYNSCRGRLSKGSSFDVTLH